MLKGLWIRLDIPYSEGANIMRAALAYEDSDTNKIDMLLFDGLEHIPQALEKVYQEATAKEIILDNSLTLVYPHDSRHGIAWPAKEEADKKGILFSRHIPNIMSFPTELTTAYENLDTGSPEDTLSKADAQKKVMELNAQAQDNFSSNDLLEAMTDLRHALWLVLRHFGWSSPGTVYTLRNLGYTFRSTGNPDNEAEFFFLISKLTMEMLLSPPDKADWDGSISLLDTLIELTEAMNGGPLALLLRQIREQL